MFGLIKKVFIILLSFSKSLPTPAKIFDHTKCTSLNNEACLAGPTLIDLNSNEYYYPFVVSLYRYNGSFNTLDDLSSWTCVPNKTEDVNGNGFNMITRTNQSKILRKCISCDCECKFDLCFVCFFIDDLIINNNRSHLLLLLSQKTSIKKYILTNYHSNNRSKEIDFNNILQR